ncbi:MAG: hypothetical protein ABR976_08780 [Terracidiphilus sp.]|jgi:hypothetical protein
MKTRTHDAARKLGNEKGKKLNKEASHAVKGKAREIVKALATKAFKGDLKITQLLMDLSKGKPDAEETVKERPLLALAAKLAAEPEWPLDAPYEDWGEDDGEQTEVECRELTTA